ncbi:hypothetical protein [Pseudogracilibacillus auburnensis]|nr:hypothetical protein [Pseudogracilibacillus auburnensis]
MERKIYVVKGPLFEKNIRNAQIYLLEIAKRYVEEGKYPVKEDEK